MLSTQLSAREAECNPQYLSKRRVITLGRVQPAPWRESSRTAWWADDPPGDARREARSVVRALKLNWGVEAERMVVDLDHCLFWIISHEGE